MLILARKKEEEIYIGDNIRIIVLSIRQGIVRLGIEAPEDIPINRKEVSRKDNKGGVKTE
jgi:carbon storage regulator